MKIPQLSKTALSILEKRYLLRDSLGKVIETPKEMFLRVANAVAVAEKEDNEGWVDKFYDLMASLDFLPNSPTLMNAGTPTPQLSACFYLPVTDDIDGIFATIGYAAKVHKTGGGTGFNFSSIRPRNDIVGTTGGVASGPVSFMGVFNAATEAIKQGGRRRGANLGLLNVSHPDIREFVGCKMNKGLENFNISVGVPDAFMEAVKKNEEWSLINPHNGKVTSKIAAKELFNEICEAAWKTGEPGVLFTDIIERANPTPHLGKLEGVNPCSEQPLLPYEACCLGSINLSHFVKNGAWELDRLEKTIDLAVRFLDDTITVSQYPLPEIQQNVIRTRKIGLGVMGWADSLIMMGIAYDSEQAVQTAGEIMKIIRDISNEASRMLGAGKGFYIGCTDDCNLQRNANVTTIAPTGTLSMLAACSSGIEPLFAVAYEKHVLDKQTFYEFHPLFEKIARERGFYTPELMREIAQTGQVRGNKAVPPDIQKLFPTAYDVSPEYHVAMQAAFQRFVDSAISKTVNMPETATVDDVVRVYTLAHSSGCKGVTVYRNNSRADQVLTAGKQIEIMAPKKRQRGKRITGTTEKIETPRGRIYVTINEDDQGVCEVFVESHDAEAHGVCRMVSLALRNGIEADQIIDQLWRVETREIAYDFSNSGTRVLVRSIAQGVALALGRRIYGDEYKGPYTVVENGHSGGKDPLIKRSRGDICPECGNSLVVEEGCLHCQHCGYAKCS
jgi:ribonucleoside-diphosphate reductase alpha chain